MSKSNDGLSSLIAAADNIAAEAQQTFGDLTAQQLNWKPNAESWSIGQCFDHLMTANESYFPIIEQIIKGEKPRTFWESLPVLPTFFGWMLIKYLSPESTKKLKAPDVWSHWAICEIRFGRLAEWTESMSFARSYLEIN